MGERNNGNRISAGLVGFIAGMLLFLPAVPGYCDFTGFTEEVSPNPVGKNDRFTLTIVIDYEDPEQVEFEIPQLPEGISLYSGPLIRPVWVQLENGTYRKKVRITTTFRASRTGRTVMGRFPLRVEEEGSLTDYHLIRVGLWQDRRLKVPYEPEWDIPESPVYTGQAVPVVLRVAHMEEVVLFDQVTVEQPAGAMFEPIAGIGDIESRSFGEITLYDIPVSSYMLTPSQPGRVILPAANVKAGETTGLGDSAGIQVLALPETVQTTGAIGHFRYMSSLEDREAVEGRETTLTVRLSGTGNLNFLEIPEPLAEGLTLISKKDTGDFTPGEEGYTGYRETTYVYLPEKAGQASIRVPEFRFLDPGEGNARVLPGRNFLIPVTAAPEVAIEEVEPVPFPFEPVYGTHRRFYAGLEMYSNLLWYAALLPGPLILLVVFILRRKPKVLVLGIICLLSGCAYNDAVLQAVSSATEAYERGDYEEAGRIYAQVVRENPGDAQGIYNYALCCYRNGDMIVSLQAARSAMYRAPMFYRARRLVKWLEKQLDMPGGTMPSPPYHPDLFFIVLVISVNGAAAGALLRILKKRGVYAIVSILLLSLAVPALVFLGFSARERNNPSGIIRVDDIHLTKIPSETAMPWVPVSKGAAFEVLQETSGYYLVRDGRGAEGWIRTDVMVRDSEILFLLDEKSPIE